MTTLPLSAYTALVATVGIGVCHYFNGDNWDYRFGTLFFAGVPFAMLSKAGVEVALAGYTFGAVLLIGLTLFAYSVEYVITGEWTVRV